MRNEVIKILFDIINDAANGYVKMTLSDLNMAFYTKIENTFSNVGEESYPVLEIENFECFVDSIIEYINNIMSNNYLWSELPINNDIFTNKVKDNLCYLLSNATLDDLKHPINLVQRYNSFLENDTFAKVDDGFYSENLDCNVNVQRIEQTASQETPYALSIKLSREIDNEIYNYYLPYLRYGVTEVSGIKTMYLYAIQNVPSLNNSDNSNQLKFNKDINRKLYKLNKGIDATNENLLDVSPSFLLVESILISLAKKEGIEHIIMPTCLPMRIMIKKRVFGNADKYKDIRESKIKALGIIKDIDTLEYNLTKRFIRVAFRCQYHFSGVKIKPVNASFLDMEIGSSDNYINNVMLLEIFNKVSENSNIVSK